MSDTRSASEENFKGQNTAFKILEIKILEIIQSCYGRRPSIMFSCLVCVYFEDYFFKDFNVIKLMIDFNILCALSSAAFFLQTDSTRFYLDKHWLHKALYMTSLL